MSAPDDLARLIAEELALLDGDPDAFAKGDLYSHPVNIETRRDYMRKGKHLASVVSRRDADLRTRRPEPGDMADITVRARVVSVDDSGCCYVLERGGETFSLGAVTEAHALDADTREVSDSPGGGNADASRVAPSPASASDDHTRGARSE